MVENLQKAHEVFAMIPARPPGSKEHIENMDGVSNEVTLNREDRSMLPSTQYIGFVFHNIPGIKTSSSTFILTMLPRKVYRANLLRDI